MSLTSTDANISRMGVTITTSHAAPDSYDRKVAIFDLLLIDLEANFKRNSFREFRISLFNWLHSFGSHALHFHIPIKSISSPQKHLLYSDKL